MKRTGLLVTLLLYGTTAGAQRPTFVVDGMPVDAPSHPIIVINGVRIAECGGPARLPNLDPAVIDQVEVLKGPAAAAAYGPEGGMGVIAITTRKGAIVSAANCGPSASAP